MANVTMKFDAETAKAVQAFVTVENKQAKLLSMEEKAAARRKRLQEDGKRGSERNIDSLTREVAKYASVGAAIGLATRALSDMNAERQKAAEFARQSQTGMGSLAQMASSDWELKRMVKAARTSMRETGMTREDAGGLQFELESSGKADNRQLYASLYGMADPRQMVNAVATLQNAMGKSQTGGDMQVLDKLFFASSQTKTNVSDLAMATAQAGKTAGLTGTSDEQLLAAMAVASRGETGAPEARTQIEALIQAAIKSKGRLDTTGGVMGIVDQLSGMSEKKRRRLLGRKEALKGYAALSANRGEVASLESQLGTVDEEARTGGINYIDTSGGAIIKRGTVTQRRVQAFRNVFANSFQQGVAERRMELAQEAKISPDELSRQAAMARAEEANLNADVPFAARWANRQIAGAAGWLGADADTVESLATAPQAGEASIRHSMSPRTHITAALKEVSQALNMNSRMARNRHTE